MREKLAVKALLDHPEVDIVAVCDINRDRAKNIAQEIHLIKCSRITETC